MADAKNIKEKDLSSIWVKKLPSDPEHWQRQAIELDLSRYYIPPHPQRPPSPPPIDSQLSTPPTPQSEIPSKTGVTKDGFVTERLVTARLASIRFQSLFMDDDDLRILKHENKDANMEYGDKEASWAQRFCQPSEPSPAQFPARDPISPCPSIPRFEGILGERIRSAATSEEGQKVVYRHDLEKREAQELVYARQLRRQKAGMAHFGDANVSYNVGRANFRSKFSEPAHHISGFGGHPYSNPARTMPHHRTFFDDKPGVDYEEVSEESQKSMEGEDTSVYQAPIAKLK